MNTPRLIVSLSLVLGLTTACTTMDRPSDGGIAEVNFHEPDRFTDLARTDGPGQGADEGYMRELSRHLMRSSAAVLPPGSRLSVTITDVDMAGEFEPQRGANFRDIRIVKSIYAPRIELLFRLTDAAGNIVAEGERQLRDPAFDWNVSPVGRDDPLRHEKALLDTFLRELARL
jgi:hypothetical protein